MTAIQGAECEEDQTGDETRRRTTRFDANRSRAEREGDWSADYQGTGMPVYLLNRSKGLQYSCLQCFDAVGWVAGRASGL